MEYKDLVQHSSKLSGYYREKMDKNIQFLAKTIVHDQKSRNIIILQDPKVIRKIISRAKGCVKKYVDI